MSRHSKNERGLMGAVIASVLAVFLVLHLIFPAVTLWPAGVVTLIVAAMIASHLGRSSRRDGETSRVCSRN